MKKLMPKDIDDLLTDYYEGTGVTKLSKFYKVTKGTIYYHIKIQATRKKILVPEKYLDHLKNQIISLQQKIDSGSLNEEQVKYAESEIGRLRYWLKVDRSCLPAEPFVLQ